MALPFPDPKAPGPFKPKHHKRRLDDRRWLMKRLLDGLSDEDVERMFGVRRVRKSRAKRADGVLAKTRVTIRVTEQESRELQARALEDGCTMSELLREGMAEWLGIGDLQEIEH